ncbi:hypothetical protein QQ73_15995 [Candidatus Endoriftia persephone str. Guaymas]|nr:hypothetical protein [Candidatus Endoriftia persephone str. Guaymas]
MAVKKDRVLWLSVGVLLTALVTVVVYKVWPILYPKAQFSAPLDPGCDLRAGPCVSSLPGGGSISFVIEPREIPLVRPLQLQVTLQGIEAERVEVDFKGVDMNMGFNRPQLSRVAEGRYSGKGILPVCVRDAMEWEATVLVTTDDGLLAAPYRFITVKPGQIF